MRLIAPTLHRVLDFITVAAFAVAPTLLHLTGVAALLAYALAVVHLTLTLLTRFPAGPARAVPFAWHRGIELVVGVALVLLALLAPWGGDARAFYLVAGLVIFAVWALSSSGAEAPSAHAPSRRADEGRRV
ncbi:MAG TPA: hypothetical protein VJN39_01300 [Gemmatimonadales bacterium]|nr:hypothetical protein [Gemmatimonadales bacterium]